MKGCPAFPKAPALLEPHHQIVLCHIFRTFVGVCVCVGGLPLFRVAVGVFYSPKRLGKYFLDKLNQKILMNYNPQYYKYIYIYIYIYICMYIVIHRHCFVVSQLFSVARHVERLKLGSKPSQLYARLSIRPLGQQAYHVGQGIIRYYVATAAFVCLHFYTLPDTRVLKSFEELCIMRATVANPFARVL